MLTDHTLRLPDGEVTSLVRAGVEGAGTLLFAHANGLNAGAYRPMLDALPDADAGGPAVVALDLRGHGRTTLPAQPGALTRWDLYAEDIKRIVAGLAPAGPLTVAGHSLGAVSGLLAVANGLDAARLLLVEPVVIPRVGRLLARSPLRGPLLLRRGLAARAARRREGWPDAGAARAQYAERGFFARWDAGALDGYLERGLVEAHGGVRLACAPAWEAATFAAQGHRFWRPLAEAAARMPVRVLKARGGSTVPDADRLRLVRAGVRLTEMEGGHMLPAERPAQVAAWLAMALAEEGV